MLCSTWRWGDWTRRRRRWGGPDGPRGGSRCIPLLGVSMGLSVEGIVVLTMPVEDVEAVDHHLPCLKEAQFTSAIDEA